MLNGETRRAPAPPDPTSYPAWETTSSLLISALSLPVYFFGSVFYFVLFCFFPFFFTFFAFPLLSPFHLDIIIVTITS
jgi:hypothetical protein